MSSKHLRRSKTDRMIAGVCGGIAEYFGIDPTIVRLVFLIAIIGLGVSLWIYPILWIVIPLESDTDDIEDAEIVQ